MSNAFETFAEATKPAFQSRREVAADRRAITRKRQDEEAQLAKAANAQDRHELEEILDGPYGPAMAELRRRLRALAFADAPRLLVFIEASPLRRAPESVRWVALRMIGKAIARVRIREGLPPFDDGLPGDAPKAVHVIKDLLGVR